MKAQKRFCAFIYTHSDTPKKSRRAFTLVMFFQTDKKT
jgi:hypothetical protein